MSLFGCGSALFVRQLGHHADKSARARVFFRDIWRACDVVCLRCSFAFHFLFRAQVELEGIEDFSSATGRSIIACVFRCSEDVLDLGFLLVARKQMRYYDAA